MEKIADTPSFRLLDILVFHMRINGNSSINKSDTRLKTLVTTVKDLYSIQRPGISGFQILALGVH